MDPHLQQRTANTTSVQTPSVGAAPQLPFAASVAISGSGLTRLSLGRFRKILHRMGSGSRSGISKHRVSPTVFDVIHVMPLPGTATSYTLPSTLSTGKTLEQGHLYSLEITFALTHGEPLGDKTTQPLEVFLSSFLCLRAHLPMCFCPS